MPEKVLDFLLGDFDRKRFFEDFFQKTSLHITGKHGRFDTLFNWDSLNVVLNSSPHPHPTVKFAEQNNQTKPIDYIHMINLVQSGATLIVEDIDRYDANLGNFLSKFTEEMGENARFNLYLSQNETPGYGIHYDTHNFFILQLSGEKEWWVYPETVKNALFYQKKHVFKRPPEESVYFHDTLKPGDLLYVPRGHWHEAVARGGHSMHLTLAMFTKTGIDFLEWLVQEATDYEKLRSDLMPRNIYSEKDIETHGSISVENLKREIKNILDEPDIFERFLQYRVGISKRRVPFSFPYHTLEKINDESKIWHRKPQIFSLYTKDRKIVLVCGSQEITFPVSMKEVLEYIFSKNAVSLKILQEKFPMHKNRFLEKTLTLLIREGIVSFNKKLKR